MLPASSPRFALGALSLLATVHFSSQQLLQMCGGRTNATLFQLVSPDYPLAAPPGLRCEVTVEAASASVCGLELDIGALSLPCPSDRLTVADQPVCGAPLAQSHFHWPETKLMFRGGIEEGDGFNITVKQVECKHMKTNSWCGGELTGETIHIQSPGYPHSYPGGLECQYTIIASDAGVCQMEIRLHKSFIEESVNCSKGSLQIGEERFCGKLNGVRTFNINKQLNISFVTDLGGTGKGFNLTARQIRCVDDKPVTVNEHLASDKNDSPVDCDPELYSSVSRDGYPGYSLQYNPFISRPVDNSVSLAYLPPQYYQGNQRPPLDQYPHRVPPNRQYSSMNPFYISQYQPSQLNLNKLQTRPVQNFPEQNYGSSFYRAPVYQQTQFGPPYRQNLPYNPYNHNNQFSSSGSSYWLGHHDVRQTSSQYQQCCNQAYADSHFLLVSPGFPRSTTTDCIYTINRYSSVTYQIRFQFRYFWAGEDLGSGCSGGYLEIDGNKVCGCKTGTSWTSQFADSETTKTLHLKLDTPFNRLFNGFVIEVYQDDSYSQRYSRQTEAESESASNLTQQSNGRVANFSQFVETFVERIPVDPTGEGYQVVDRASAQPVWDASRQSWTLPTDWFCLRWNFQDWLVLAREVLWAKYQCPVSSSSSSTRSDVTQSDPCRTCLYLCRQNCQCCQ